MNINSTIKELIKILIVILCLPMFILALIMTIIKFLFHVIIGFSWEMSENWLNSLLRKLDSYIDIMKS